jgi:hypothetical protein
LLILKPYALLLVELVLLGYHHLLQEEEVEGRMRQQMPRV